MQIFKALAPLFDYPDDHFHDYLDRADSLADKYFSGQYLTWLVFSERVKKYAIGELQEMYVSSFDVKANSSLDVGHILFGENKMRNTFLVHLKDEHTKAKIDCGCEMSDYLPNLLQLLSLTQDDGFREEMAVSIILPAARLMKSGLGSGENFYFILLEFLIGVLEESFPESNYQEYVPIIRKNHNSTKRQCHHG